MAGSQVGEISPIACWELLSRSGRAALVDVRTVAEWSYVGVPDLGPLNRQALFLEWQSWPAMAVSDTFTVDLIARLEASGLGPDDAVMFICRSGVRSLHAARALAEVGWSNCHNVANGFEGPLDDARHRGGTAGWKFDGLPWRQS